jgi:hypothetical protein
MVEMRFSPTDDVGDDAGGVSLFNAPSLQKSVVQQQLSDLTSCKILFVI